MRTIILTTKENNIMYLDINGIGAIHTNKEGATIIRHATIPEGLEVKESIENLLNIIKERNN